MKYSAAVVLSLCCFSLWAEAAQEEEDLVADASHVFLMARAEAIPNGEGLEENTDHYLEGYIQALVDMHFYEHQVVVVVKDQVVYLYNLPNNALLCNSIISFVEDVPCVEEVKAMNGMSCEEVEARRDYVAQPCISGVWFPQSTMLFQPLVANPRQVTYSASYRAGDRVVGKNAIPISMGDDFPVYRWQGVFPMCGDLQIGVQACIWAVFNFEDVPHMDGTCCELVNTDYLLGIPLTYAFDRWAFRLRLYHISSHLGDEFLVNRPFFLPLRMNPSFEALEFMTSYQITRGLRVYFGPGLILHNDRSFDMETFYVDYGAEWRFGGSRFVCHRLYGTWFLALDVENWQVRDWQFDWTIKGGYEFSKLAGIGRKMRLYASYHDGFSYEGQFFKLKTNYGEFGLSWGF
ncbi:MAG: hypothetical protein K940chlam2_01757 [Chlamydiae bacterium]|nr:hypothetical protein [Chlamydiota bacterium]